VLHKEVRNVKTSYFLIKTVINDVSHFLANPGAIQGVGLPFWQE